MAQLAEEIHIPVRESASGRTASTIIQAALLLGFAAFIFFFHLGTYGLWEPDEGRYAEIAREMLVTHDYIVPHLNFVPYVEKPPLLHWLTAISLRVLGNSEFAARLVVARFALLGVLVTYLFALRTLGQRRAMLAGAILTTSPLYAVMAQVLTTDMLLSSLMTLAIFGFYFHWSEGRAWRWLFYVAMGFGALAKGPVAIVLPLAVVFLFLITRGELNEGFKNLRLASGLALTAAIAVPWFAAVALRVPGFLQFYFVGEHFRRFFEIGYSHGAPAYFYVPVVLLGGLPWIVAAPFFRWRIKSGSAVGFCAIAAATIFVFFSIASAKLVSYVLPMFPLMAIVFADRISDLVENSPGRLVWIGLIITFGAAAAFVFVKVAPIESDYFVMARSFMLVAAATATVGGIAATGLFFLRREWAALAAIGLATAIVLTIASYGRLRLEPLRSYAALSRDVARTAPDARLVCYHKYVQALAFYTGKRVAVVGPWLGELAFGARIEPEPPQYFLPADDALMKVWNSPEKVVLVLDDQDLDKLKPQLGRVKLVGSEFHKRAVTQVR